MQPADMPHAEAGFTLIEVLVAFVVAALLMMIVMPAALTAREREGKAQEKLRAIRLVAELVRARAAGAFEEGERTGTRDRLVWHSSESVVKRDPRGFLALTRIEAHVEGPGGQRLFAASTRRLRTVTQP